ncbi:MAG TPA: hypothetical protein VFC90_13125 [Planctomycetota bacterium]|nr:hypothetical protein [Planctomycetota bacterium]
MADETIEGGDEGAEFLPDILQKPRNDIWTALLGVTAVAFLISVIVVGMELYQQYDVKFFFLS